MIAIHSRPGSFSDRWISYCQENNVKFKMVDVFSSNIINELAGCIGLMWHWHHHDHRSVLFARQLIFCLEKKGIHVFPNFDTCWHFDDKIGQKYLLEAIGAPFVKSYVFYEYDKAISWADSASFPKVFKLRSGAGSENVRLIKNRKEAISIIKTAFKKGFKQKNRLNFLKERIWKFRKEKTLSKFVEIYKGFARLIVPHAAEVNLSREKNYIYFQDFIDGNDHDVRVIVIGKRAFGIKRMVRKNDFRASGSGVIHHDPVLIPEECILHSFRLAREINAQCIAIDYIFSSQSPLVVEISYAFSPAGYSSCPGYWDESLKWVPEKFSPQDFMVIDFLELCNRA